MDGLKGLETNDFETGSRGNGTDGKTVPSVSAPRKRGRPPGARNKTTRAVKALIEEAHPEQFMIRVMKGQKFQRAAEAGARRTVAVFPTLGDSIAAAQALLRKIAPDMKATELSGPDDGPIEFAELTNEEAACRMVAVIERGLYQPDEKVMVPVR